MWRRRGVALLKHHSRELLVPILAVAAPEDVTESLNWTWTESFSVELPSDRMRSQT